MPYWDSVLDQRIPVPKQSVLWSDELMGGAKPGDLTEGAFKGWLLENVSYVLKLHGCEKGTDNVLELEWIKLNLGLMQGCPVPKSWKAFEFTHGNPHIFVGEDMVLTSTSANDPMFFIYHSFVDLVWEQWRQREQTMEQRSTEYPPDNELCSARSHFSTSPMNPFGDLLNINGLSNDYTGEKRRKLVKAALYWPYMSTFTYLFIYLFYTLQRVRYGVPKCMEI
ncbi:unnamed protein product [Heligmosomoides polygyrus]|uniref:Tyrosinase_Cu-bd domain-containing protein n=1 Tax=Heligmosomoides polygyrus TaxID=6339 RepID=A0A183GHW6_HELPZ|nr:unnamed protein product [Heligmosomoides polygyrus]